ncbi:MAG: hypothetical protein AAGA68_15395 [Pseudomonadota bacterium]
MTNVTHLAPLSLALLICGVAVAGTESASSSPPTSPSITGSRFQIFGGVTAARTPIQIDSIDVVATGDLLIDDVDLSVGEEIDISSRTLLLGFSYRPFPLVELSVASGFANTTSDAQLTVSGSFLEPLPLLGDSFSVTSTNERDSSGTSLQGSLGLYLPIVRDPEAPLLLRAGVILGHNDLDNIDTRTVASSLMLIHSREWFSRRMNLALGVTHLSIDRVVEFSASIGGERIDVRQEQSLQEPWSLTGSLVVPLSGAVSLIGSTSNNFNGMSSVALRLGYRF